MASSEQTTKRHLNKPQPEDFVNVINDICDNMDNLDDAVPDSRKVNGHALNGDITVSKSDVGLGNVDNVQQVPATRKVNNKALSSDINLQGTDIQVSSSDSRKVDAAIANCDSETASLKSAIDFNDGNQIIQFIKDHCIITNQNTGETVDLTPAETTADIDCAVVDCNEGDLFTITGQCVTSVRLWAFVDANNKMISKADANANVTNLEIKAPANAKKCIINIRYSGYAIKGKAIGNHFGVNDADILSCKDTIYDIAKSEEITLTWTIGGLQNNGDLNNSLLNRARANIGFMNSNKGDAVVSADGISYRLFFYSSNDATSSTLVSKYPADGSYIKGITVIPKNDYYVKINGFITDDMTTDLVNTNFFASNVKIAYISMKDKIAENFSPAKIINAEPNWFVAGYKIVNGGNNSPTSDEACAYTNGLISAINNPIVLYSTDNTVLFNAHDSNTYINTGWKQVLNVLPGAYNITAKTADGSNIKTADIQKIRLKVTDDFIGQNIKKISKTNSAFNLFGASVIVGYGISTSGDREGMLVKTNDTTHCMIPFSLYADEDCTVCFGKRDSDTVVDLFVDGSLVKELGCGNFYKITKGTKFAISATGTSADNKMDRVFFALDGIEPETSMIYGCASPFTDYSGSQGSFAVGDKIFLINSNYNKYYVIQGETYLNNGSLVQNVGHANSANYNNGKAYISDHVIPENIYVFDVDDENNTLTYEKTITIPVETTGTSHYVFDSEKQIVSLGWNEGDSSTGKYLVVSLWVKTSDGYIESWHKNIIRPSEVIQGFTVQDRYLYYLESYRSTTHMKMMYRVDLTTGITDYFDGDVSSYSISNYEAESLIPISTGVFYAITNNGIGYFVFYKPTKMV